MKSYSEVLKGPRVVRDASLLMGGTPSAGEIQAAVSASYTEETVVLNLEVTEGSPDEARLVAGAVSTAFTRFVGTIESSGVVNRRIATAEVILPPTEPAEPTGPPTTILFGGALVVGIVLGLGVALTRRALRDTVDTPEVVATRLSAPLLGSVPALRRPPEHPALLTEPALGATGRKARLLRARAESYRRVRTALRSMTGDPRCVVLTGTGHGRGTSTTAVDIAVALGATGDTVCSSRPTCAGRALPAASPSRGGSGSVTSSKGGSTSAPRSSGGRAAASTSSAPGRRAPGPAGRLSAPVSGPCWLRCARATTTSSSIPPPSRTPPKPSTSRVTRTAWCWCVDAATPAPPTSTSWPSRSRSAASPCSAPYSPGLSVCARSRPLRGPRLR